jgi:hypothetical protein
VGSIAGPSTKPSRKNTCTSNAPTIASTRLPRSGGSTLARRRTRPRVAAASGESSRIRAGLVARPGVARSGGGKGMRPVYRGCPGLSRLEDLRGVSRRGKVRGDGEHAMKADREGPP